MSDIGSVGSSNSSSNESAEAAAAKAADTYTPSELEHSGGWGKFEQYLGKKAFAQFKKNLEQQISTQIKHEQQRAQEASDELAKSEE